MFRREIYKNNWIVEEKTMQRKHVCTLIKFQINITQYSILIINFIFNNLLKLYISIRYCKVSLKY